MGIVVIEEGHPNGRDLVVDQPVYTQHHGVVHTVVDGVPVRLVLRLICADGKLHALRRVVVTHPSGESLKKVDLSKWVDDVETANG